MHPWLLIGNLHVDAAHHGDGVGTALLEWAANRAKMLGAHQLALITTASNPALPWYQRHGFRSSKTVSDAAYERLTAIPGRVLLEKPLPA